MLVFLKVKESLNFFFILFSIIMFFFCLYLYFNNKRLKQRISKLEIETKEILERKLVKESPSDLVSIKTLSLKEESKEKKQKSTTNQPIKKSPKSNYTYKYNQSPTTNKTESIQTESRTITNRTPKSVSSPKPSKPTPAKLASPVTSTPTPKPKIISNQDFNINEFIPQDEKVVSRPKTKKTTTDYLEEISAKIAGELNPQTIELTEYEKVQEEQAVISYQELLALKDKGELQAEEDENINFIEDLREFRNKLN